MTPFEKHISALLSLIAGMVDLTGFLTLGNIFTAHITGNLVIFSAVIVRGGPVNIAQLLAIPAFIIAVAITGIIARGSGKTGLSLVRLLLKVHLLLLAATFVFCVLFRPSSNPHGLLAGFAMIIAVCAMGCQFAMLRTGLPSSPSTAVMTGNLTNIVLEFLNTEFLKSSRTLAKTTSLPRVVWSLCGFLIGCLAAAIATTYLSDWAWALPVLACLIALNLK